MGEVAQLGPGQGAETEVMVALDVFVPQAAAGVAGAQGRDAQRAQVAQASRGRQQGRGLGGGRQRGRAAPGRRAEPRGQREQAVAFHAQQGHAGAHVLEPAVGLAPAEALADGARERDAAGSGVAAGGQPPDQGQFLGGEVAPAVARRGALAHGSGPGGWPGAARAARRAGSRPHGSQRRAAGAPPSSAQRCR